MVDWMQRKQEIMHNHSGWQTKPAWFGGLLVASVDEDA